MYLCMYEILLITCVCDVCGVFSMFMFIHSILYSTIHVVSFQWQTVDLIPMVLNFSLLSVNILTWTCIQYLENVR